LYYNCTILAIIVNEIIPIQTRIDAIQTISSIGFICNNNNNNNLGLESCKHLLSQSHFSTSGNGNGGNGINGIQQLNSFLSSYHVPVIENPYFKFAVIDCLWNYVIGNENNEKTFLQTDGVHNLLSIMESSEDFVKYIAISMLIDFIQLNDEYKNEIILWKSPHTQQNAADILTQIWVAQERNEIKKPHFYDEQEVGEAIAANNSVVQSNSDNFSEAETYQDMNNDDEQEINNEIGGDNGNKQQQQQAQPLSARSSSGGKSTFNNTIRISRVNQSLTRMDFRPKIFHLFSILEGYDSFTTSTKSMANQSAIIKMRVHDKSLTDGVWKHIKDDLERECIRPTSPDEKMLTSKLEDSVKRMQHLDAEIERIKHEEQIALRRSEEEFYQTLQERKKVNEQKTTKKKMTVMEAKIQKMKMVQASTAQQTRALISSPSHELV